MKCDIIVNKFNYINIWSDHIDQYEIVSDLNAVSTFTENYTVFSNLDFLVEYQLIFNYSFNAYAMPYRYLY